MKGENQNICDKCRRRVTEKKCIVCDCDLCENCSAKFKMSMYSKMGPSTILDAMCCRECKEAITPEVLLTIANSQEIKTFRDYMKKIVLANRMLDDGGKVDVRKLRPLF